MPRRRIRLAMPHVPPPAADAFVAVPLSLLPPMTASREQAVRELYERALAEARAVVIPPPTEYDLPGRN